MIAGSYTVPFAGSQITIDWRGAKSEAILRFLYRELLLGPRAGETARIESTTDGGADEIVVRRGEDVLYSGSSEGAAAEALMHWSSQELASDCRIGPLFHAAAISSQGRGIMLPGVSGSGKSTLAAWLAHSGFDCLSDEMACVAQESFELEAFLRPLHIKGSATTVLEELGCMAPFESADAASRGLRSERGRLVPVSLLNQNNVLSQPRLELIVFPRYEATAQLSAVRLSKAHAGMHLMKHSVNARNLSDHGFRDVTHIAEQVPAYVLTYSSFDGVIDRLEQMLAVS